MKKLLILCALLTQSVCAVETSYFSLRESIAELLICQNQSSMFFSSKNGKDSFIKEIKAFRNDPNNLLAQIVAKSMDLREDQQKMDNKAWRGPAPTAVKNIFLNKINEIITLNMLWNIADKYGMEAETQTFIDMKKRVQPLDKEFTKNYLEGIYNKVENYKQVRLNSTTEALDFVLECLENIEFSIQSKPKVIKFSNKEFRTLAEKLEAKGLVKIKKSSSKWTSLLSV